MVKLLLAAIIPLSADEAYYWVWAQRPQLSYFDHPPFVSWLFYIGQLFQDWGHAVRWPAVALGHLTLGVWILILNPLMDQKKISLWLYLALFSPLLGFGSIIVTPDIPLMFFWSLGIYAVLRALQSENIKYYVFLGVALGLGFCSKYHIVLFVPCLLAFLSIEKKWSAVSWHGVFTTLVVGLLFCAPVLIWNYNNDFASFEFQLKHGLEKTSYSWEWTTGYVLGQILILFPLIFWASVRTHISKDIRWALYFGWGPLIFFFLTSFRALVEANWPIIAYPSLFCLALFYPRIRSFTVVTTLFWGLLMSAVIASSFIPSIRKLDQKIEEPYIFKEIAKQTQGFEPLYGSSYQVAASLWYFRKSPVFKLKGISRFDFFDTLPEAIPTQNKFYLVKPDVNGLPTWISEQQWQVKELKKVSSQFLLLEVSRP